MDGQVARGIGDRSLKGTRAVRQEHGHAAAERVIGHDKVRGPVAVEVPGGDRGGPRPDGDLLTLDKEAMAVAQQDANSPFVRETVPAAVGRGQVEEPVAVEVVRHHPAGAPAGLVGAADLEATVAVAQQHADPLGAAEQGLTAHGEIRNIVPVEIPDRHRLRPAADAVGLGRLKGAVPVAEQHTDVVAAQVGHDEIEVAVPVEVGGGRTERGPAGAVTPDVAKPAEPIPQQDGHGVQIGVGDRQVQDAVFVVIPHRRGIGPAAQTVSDGGIETEQQAIFQRLAEQPCLLLRAGPTARDMPDRGEQRLGVETTKDRGHGHETVSFVSGVVANRKSPAPDRPRGSPLRMRMTWPAPTRSTRVSFAWA